MKEKELESFFRGARISLLTSLPVLMFAFVANPIVILLAYLTVAAGIFFAGLEDVKPPNVGVIFFLGKRTTRKLDEGLGWVIPGLEKIELISLGPKPYDVGDDNKFYVDAIEEKIVDGVKKEEMLQMICAYLITIKADKDNAEKTLDIPSKKELDVNVVKKSKAAVRQFASINSYKELMANLAETQDEMSKCLEELDEYLEIYGYKIESFALSKMTPKSETFRAAAESKAREEKERDGEKIQQAHLRDMAQAEMDASNGPDGKPTISWGEAKRLVQVDLGKAKGIVISGGEGKILLGEETLK